MIIGIRNDLFVKVHLWTARFTMILLKTSKQNQKFFLYSLHLHLNAKWITVATPPVVLCWLCDLPWMGCTRRTTPYIYVARTRNNRVIMACELYCCLLPQCEALRIWRSEFPIATLPIGFYIKNKRGIRGIVLEKTFIVQYLSHSSSNRIHKYNRELSLLNEVKFIHGGHSMWTDPGPVTQYFRFCSNLTPSVLGGITFKKCMNHFIPSLCTTTACQMIELESCSNPQQLWAF